MMCLNVGVVCLLFFVIKCTCMSISEIEDFSNFLKKTSQLDEPLKKGTYPDDDADDEVVSDHAWETSGKFEGDLILNERQRRLIVEDVAQGLARNGLKDSTKRWPDNVVTYYIQKEHFTENQVQAIMDGIADLAQASCVKFKPYRKGDRDAVVIQGSRRGCFSQVGYQGGYQVLNLSGRHPVGRGCFRHGTVVHELLHTLGFYHMQSSADRDDYIDVRWENIIDQARHNFRKYNAFTVSDFGVGYDYESVLHYSKGAFSKNGRPTLVPKMSGASIGQRVGLSDKDTQKLNKMYCDADSNNFEGSEEDTTQKSTIVKGSKNKPFKGRGIGYHQGKTVVIKLPAAETYTLTDSPTFHEFDYFSKAPETVSTAHAEGFGAGKEIGYSYKPLADTNNNNNEKNTKLHTKVDADSYNGLKPENAYGENDLNRVPTSEPQTDKANEQEDQNYEIKVLSQGTESPRGDSVKYSDDLNEAFERLGKIISTHVYPSHKPNINIYKTISDYSDYYKPGNEPKPKFVEEDEAYGHSLADKLTKDEAYSQKANDKTPHPFVKSLHSSDSKYNGGNVDNRPEKDSSSGDGDGDIIQESDLSYRTPSPFIQMHKGKKDKILAPEYATLEKLVYKHNLSSLYNPKNFNSNDKLLEGKQTIFGYVVPLGDEKDHPERIHEKHTLYKYTYPEEHSDYHEHPSSNSNYFGSKQEYYGPTSARKKVYSLYGVLVPLANDWHKDFDQHRRSHYSEDYKSNEDFR